MTLHKGVTHECCFGCHQVYNRFHAAATRKQYYDYLFISNRKTYRFVLCFVKTQNHIWCKSNNTLRSHGRETMHTNISTYNRQWNVTNDDDKMLEVQRDHTFFQWSGSKPTSTTTYINNKKDFGIPRKEWRSIISLTVSRSKYHLSLNITI